MTLNFKIKIIVFQTYYSEHTTIIMKDFKASMTNEPECVFELGSDGRVVLNVIARELLNLTG